MRSTLQEFSKEHTGKQELDRMQDSLRGAVRQFTDQPFFDGVLVENIELTAGIVNYVLHKLGREHRGYHIVRRNQFILHCESVSDSTANKLALEVTRDVTVSLWVF